jgi:hypothetical protein
MLKMFSICILGMKTVVYNKFGFAIGNENGFARAFGGDGGTASAGGESPPDPPSLLC